MQRSSRRERLLQRHDASARAEHAGKVLIFAVGTRGRYFFRGPNLQIRARVNLKTPGRLCSTTGRIPVPAADNTPCCSSRSVPSSSRPPDDEESAGCS